MLDEIRRGRQSYLHVDSPTFGRVDRSILVGTFRLTARRFRRRLLHFVDDLTAGRTTIPAFLESTNKLVRTEFGISFALGALSIDPFHNLTPRDIRVINSELDLERRFLRAFAEDLSAGDLVLTETQRAGLYLQALRGMFELGRVEALPSGPYLWVLGPTEHCGPCIEASLGGPYQRRTDFGGLGLPFLPGIPGSGDICRGLTRCGCRIRMADRPIPNEDIQLEVKYVLAEVLNDSS